MTELNGEGFVQDSLGFYHPPGYVEEVVGVTDAQLEDEAVRAAVEIVREEYSGLARMWDEEKRRACLLYTSPSPRD